MGLIDVVKKAQSLGPGDAQEAGLCGLKPTWLISEETPSPQTANGELIRCLGVPSGCDSIKLREEQENRLVAELKAQSDDSLSLSLLDGLLRSYFEQVLTPNPNSNTSPNPKANAVNANGSPHGHTSSDKRRVARTPFPKLLQKVAPLLGQKLLSSTLRVCLTLRYWDAVRALLDSHALNGNLHTDLIPILIEHDEASLLCMWMRNVRDPRFSDLLLVLKCFLKSNLRAGKGLAEVRTQWRQMALVAIGRISELGSVKENDEDVGGNSERENADTSGHSQRQRLKEDAKVKAILVSAAVDHFQPFELCLHYLVASGHDEAVLASIVSQLDNGEVLKLLRYLKKWLEKYSKQGSLCTLHSQRKDLWVPSLRDVLQWVSILLDAHLTSFVLCPDFHAEIQSVQLLIKGMADVGHKLGPLVGVTDHLQTNGMLPMLTSSHGADDHVIEYLEI